jgi:hypothetical protein
MTSLSSAVPLALVLAISSCAAGSSGSISGMGAGGSTVHSSSSATGGTGGAGGGGCPAGAPGALSFKGLHTTTYDNTMESVSVTLGNPNDSTLAAYVETGTLRIEGQDATWQIDLELHLQPNVMPPLAITPKSFPNYVVGACFSRGAGLANTFCNDDAFSVTVKQYACDRISGTFAGHAASSDGFNLLSVNGGTFDLPIGPKP